MSDIRVVPAVVYDALRTGGLPIDPAARARAESHFGHDFSGIRVHEGSLAAEAAREVSAKAFTVGRDVVFGEGQYAPRTREGMALLSHELAHTLQQKAAAPLNAHANGVGHHAGMQELKVSPPDDAAEREADDLSRSLTSDTPPAIRGTSTSALQRAPAPGSPSSKQAAPRQKIPEFTSFTFTDDTKPAVIDTSLGVDQLTELFYSIPPELLPPNTPIPIGPILTIGKYGCSIRKDGLTAGDFDISYTFDDRDAVVSSHPFGDGLQTAECWAGKIKFNLRLQQRIRLPKDLATHQCYRGVDPVAERARILAHERGHEADNRDALSDVHRFIQGELLLMPAIDRSMAVAKITGDVEGFREECHRGIRKALDKLMHRARIEYQKKSLEYATKRDPWDKEVHDRTLRLIELAEGRKEREQE